MGIHDARYKQLHQQVQINLDWSRFVSQQLQLGEVEPRSLRSHRAHYVSDRYRERFGDRHWSFRTHRNAYLLLVCEFQSAPDNRLILRLYHYAFSQLLDGLDDGTFQVASGLPVPILVALYTGRQAWDPPTLSDLLPGPLVQGSLFPLFFFDMHHMAAHKIPEEGWLPGLFALERQTDPAGILAVIRELHGRMDHPELRRAFLRFAAATTAPWSLARAGVAEREQAETTWARIDKLEDFTMLVQEIIEQREQELAEARAEARVEALRGVAALYLDEATLEACMADLQQRGRAALPQAYQVVEAAQNAGDPAAAVEALLRGTGQP